MDLGLELFPGHRGSLRSRADEVLPPLPEIHPLYLPPPQQPPADATDEARTAYLLRTFRTGRRVYFNVPDNATRPKPGEAQKVLAFADLLRAAKVPPADFVLYSFRRHAGGFGPPCRIPPLAWVYSLNRRSDVSWVAGLAVETRPIAWLHPYHRALIARWDRARVAVDDAPMGTSLAALRAIAAGVLGDWDAAVTQVRGVSLISARNVREGLRNGEWLWPRVTLC